jgi:hypothetical protein
MTIFALILLLGTTLGTIVRLFKDNTLELGNILVIIFLVLYLVGS